MISKFSVKKPLTVFVAVILVLILGVVSFTRMTPDLLPSINLPYAVVITAYPGATPEEVEEQITKPLEQTMATLENIDNISSTSAENMSQIILAFEDGANMDAVVPEIREKINGVAEYWDDTVSTPYILKINPNMLPVTVSAVSYEGMDNFELTKFIDTELLNQLEGTSGVASVDVSGNVREEIDIIISEDKVAALNEKITASIDDKFSDAEKELDKSQEELDEGREEVDEQETELKNSQSSLQSGANTLAEQTSAAQSQLINQKITIENTKTTLSAEIENLKMTIESLEESEKQLLELRDQYNELLEGKAQLESAISGLVTLQTQYNELVTQRDALETQLAGIIAMLEADPENPDLLAQKAMMESGLADINAGIAGIEASLAAQGMTPETLPAAIDALNSQLTTVNEAIATMEAAMVEMGIEPSELDSFIADIQSGLEEARSALETLEDTYEQLCEGSITIDEALSELNRQQLTASFQLSSGYSQITAGLASIQAAKTQLDSAQAQIDSARDEIESQKEMAYDSANIEITMDMITGILMAQNFSMPAGYVNAAEGGEEQYLVRVGDKITDMDELQDLLLFDTGIDGVGVVRLSDVADVIRLDNADSVYAKIDGTEGLILSFSKQSTYATATVSDNVADKFEELEAKYPGLKFTDLSDQGDYIKLIVNVVLENLLYGAVFAIIVLFLFLKDIRPTAVVACSIPISLLAAIILMYFTGITLNVISLSGLAIGVGMLVDNSIVVIENIYRLRNEGQPRFRAAVYGAKQVTGAIVASTLTTVCVFLPIVFIEGLTRQLFTDLALTIAYSLLCSLVVSITLVPAISAGLLKRTKEQKAPIFDRFLTIYEKTAAWSLDHKWVIITASVVLLAVSGAIALTKGFIFMPSMSGNQISVTVTAPEGSTYQELKGYTDEVAERIMSIEDVKTVGAMASGEESSTLSLLGGGGENSSTIYAILAENTKRKDGEISAEIVELCADIPCEITATGAMDVSSLLSAMSGSGVTLTLYGNDLDELISESERVSAELAKVEGINEVTTDLEDSTAEIRISVRKNRAMTYGLTVAQVYQAVAAELSAEAEGSDINIEGNTLATTVISEEKERTTADDIRSLVLTYTDKASGKEKKVALSHIADITETQSLNAINRKDQKRYLSISADLKEGYNITNVTSEVEEVFTDHKCPEGVKLEIGGESTAIMEAVEQLLLMLLLALVIIYLIMVAQFQSLKSPFIVMFTIPLAFTGGFLGLLIGGMEVSIVSLIGFVLLAGIIVNNGIVLIDYINQLRLSGIGKREAIIQAGVTRMRPILMTALTTILGLVMMALATGLGAELMQPMAVVSIGGLVYGTFMTLYLVPAMYDIFNRKELKRIIIDEEDEKEEELGII